MKNLKYFGIILISGMFILSSCKKDECHECHYDGANGEEIELGTKCNDELEDLEANGTTDSEGIHHEVHCHGH
ncbi:MAG: hypothetical protein EP338_12790 [Bacteroidetes bacterium]|nr:MAG: hypothetical protein EP338_12790 [Bacteroidota bacterium]